MNVSVSLRNLNDGSIEEVMIKDVADRNCFSYVDNDSNACEMCIYDDGLCFFRQSDDHLLELNLRGHDFARITTEEGTLKFPVKVVDFRINNDILVMHYIVNDEARIIEIRFLGEYTLYD